MSNENWLEVPYRVRDLYTKYAADAAALTQQPPNVGGGWLLNTDEVGPIFISKEAIDLKGLLASLPGSVNSGAQKLLGGPNPLTASLVGGAMGAGLGYGGGWLAHKMLPKYFDDDAARKWALFGGAGAAAVPLYMHGYPNVKELGWRGLLQPSRYQGREGGYDTLADIAPHNRQLQPAEAHELLRAGDYDHAHGRHPDTDAHPDITDQLRAHELDIPGALKASCDAFGITPVEDAFLEKAAEGIAGAWLGNIPVDEWGRVVMYDPYLSDHMKAVAAGLPFAAGQATGSKWVSPVDVARVAANTALGRVTGWGIGQLAKTFLGVTPYAQEQLQNAGTLAGAIRGVLGMIS